MAIFHALATKPMLISGWKAWLVGLFLIMVLLPAAGMAGESREIQVGGEQSKALNYLLGFVGLKRADPRQIAFDRLDALIKFVESAKPNGALYHTDEQGGIPSAYFEVDIARSLGETLRLTDNPEIPAVFTAPSTVRLSRWEEVDAPGHRVPKLWERLTGLAEPVFYTGIEHLFNTPDETTGAYYDYQLYRTLILARSNGRNLMISLSRQVGPSSVGKRGLIVGSDDQWDYLYTGQSGLNRFGLGWVDSYMYDSYSVALYLENEASSGVRIGMFKWLKAGWSDINMVKRSHIQVGLKRFAEVLKQILEHRRTADANAVTQSLQAIRGLPEDQLHQVVKAYLEALGRQVEKEGLLNANEVKALFKEGGYMKAMGRDEMQSVVVLEYLKQLLGKQQHVNLRQLLAQQAE